MALNKIWYGRFTLIFARRILIWFRLVSWEHFLLARGNDYLCVCGLHIYTKYTTNSGIHTKLQTFECPVQGSFSQLSVTK